MYANDVMNQKIIYVHPEEKLKSAVKKMIKNDISGLPVVDKEMRLLGIITETDILNYGKLESTPDYLELLEIMLYRQTPDSYKEELLETLNETVENAMNKNVIVVNKDTPAGEIVMKMSEKDINRVMVVEGDIIQGVISRKDILIKICDFL